MPRMRSGSTSKRTGATIMSFARSYLKLHVGNVAHGESVHGDLGTGPVREPTPEKDTTGILRL